MDREFLRQFDLDKEAVDKIMKEYGTSIKKYKENSEKAENLQEKVDALNTQNKELNDKVAELEQKQDDPADDKELTELIERVGTLEKENEAMATEKVRQQKVLALTQAGVDNDYVELLTGLIVESDEEKTLEDQVKELKESKPKLFKSDKSAGFIDSKLKGNQNNNQPARTSAQKRAEIFNEANILK